MSGTRLCQSQSPDPLDRLDETVGGYTVKQRLREEVESPFRTVRLYFFGASLASAVIAFYFSLVTLLQAVSFGEGSVEDAVTSVAINIGAILVCGGITYRDYQAKQADLARIKQGGALASLVVERPAVVASDKQPGRPTQRSTLADFRRFYRVLIAAGGADYIQTLCRSLNADQLADENTLPQGLQASDILVIPVLLQPSSGSSLTVGDTLGCWMATEATETDRNLDVTRANTVVAWPKGPAAWSEVLAPEIDTAQGKQGFNVLEKGITLLLKKNGKILRRATGQPQWSGMIQAMNVFDKNFGMPGDDQVYPVEDDTKSSN